jgi:opacity protein-like surface antigen
MNLAAVLLFGLLWSAPAIAETQFLIKSGPSWYTGDLGRVTLAGPAWGASVGFQPMEILGIELAYQGSSNRLRDPRRPQDTGIYRNGGTAMAKVFVPPMRIVRPYAGIGFGGSYLATSHDNGGFQGTTTSGYFALEFPFAVGLDFNIGPLAIGARATYRVLIRGPETFAAIYPGSRDPRGNMIDLTASAGICF